MANGRISLVTGGAGGIGQGVVARLVADGFHVAAMDVNESSMDALMAKSSTGVTPYLCDQTDEAATIAVVNKIETELGPIHALVNTIGWGRHDPDSWKKIRPTGARLSPSTSNPFCT